MHIVDGVLSSPVLIGATLLAAGGVGLGLRQLTPERMPQAALLTSLFFVISLVHLPVGPVSAHLGLTGLLGLLMGWGAFPALLVGLTLQAVFFGYGGLTALGANTLVMALPPVLIASLAARLPGGSERATVLRGFLVGSLTVLGSALLMVLVLILSDGRFTAAAQWALLGHIPVMLVEGAVTAAAAVFLHKVRPELLVQAITAEQGAE